MLSIVVVLLLYNLASSSAIILRKLEEIELINLENSPMDLNYKEFVEEQYDGVRFKYTFFLTRISLIISNKNYRKMKIG